MAGASPSFSDSHVIRTIIALQNRTGRKKLLGKIGIGEGSMRTILKKLKAKNLIDSTRQGHKLTDAGRESLNEYLKKFTTPFKVHAGDITPGEKSGMVVYNVADKLTTGVYERDIAVHKGAMGALILKYDCKLNKLKFPDEMQSIDNFPEFKSEIEEFNINFNAGDVLIVAFSDDYVTSENAAVAICLSLVDQIELFKII